MSMIYEDEMQKRYILMTNNPKVWITRIVAAVELGIGIGSAGWGFCQLRYLSIRRKRAEDELRLVDNVTRVGDAKVGDFKTYMTLIDDYESFQITAAVTFWSGVILFLIGSTAIYLSCKRSPDVFYEWMRVLGIYPILCSIMFFLAISEWVDMKSAIGLLGAVVTTSATIKLWEQFGKIPWTVHKDKTDLSKAEIGIHS